MLALSDSQLRSVWTTANGLPIEKRGVFLGRLVAQLQLRSHFTTAELDDAVRLALKGLTQKSAACWRPATSRRPGLPRILAQPSCVGTAYGAHQFAWPGRQGTSKVGCAQWPRSRRQIGQILQYSAGRWAGVGTG